VAPDLRRWLLGVGLGCGAIATAYLPPPVHERRLPEISIPPEQSLEERLYAALAKARRQATAAKKAELLMRLSRVPAGPGNGLQVVIHGDFSPSLARLLRHRVDSVWSSAVKAPPHVRVVFVVDGTTGPGGLMLPPSAANGNTCAAMLSIGAFRGDVTFTRAGRIATVLAPCAYHAVFGIPGARVQDWLQLWDYDIAGSLQWHQEPEYLEDFSGFAPPPEQRIMLKLFYFTFVGEDFTRVSCAKGRSEICRDGVLHGTGVSGVRFGTSLPQPLPGVFRIGSENLYLASMVHALGPERFGRFWRSDLPVEQAFAEAFGTNLAEWTSDWLRGRMRVPPADTAPRAGEVVFALLGITLAVGAAAAIGRRRQVT